jgi:hypothetical protein
MRIVYATLLAAELAGLVGLAGCATPPPPPPPPPAPQVLARPKPALPPATPAPICAKPAEKVAFAMAALRMQLSVTEITCEAREQFNGFTVRYRNDVGNENKVLGQFFSRAYGRQGQSNQDQYETSQINQMSQFGAQYYGADFCKTAMPMFAEIQALKTDKELEDYAVAKNFDQVLAVEECTAAPPPPPKKAVAPKKPAPAKS